MMDFFDRRKLLMPLLPPRSSFHGMTFAAKKTFAGRRDEYPDRIFVFHRGK